MNSQDSVVFSFGLFLLYSIIIIFFVILFISFIQANHINEEVVQICLTNLRQNFFVW